MEHSGTSRAETGQIITKQEKPQGQKPRRGSLSPRSFDGRNFHFQRTIKRHADRTIKRN